MYFNYSILNRIDHSKNIERMFRKDKRIPVERKKDVENMTEEVGMIIVARSNLQSSSIFF